MYCRKCGKFIGTDAELCDECRQNEAPRYGNPYQNANPYSNPYSNPNANPYANPYANTGAYQPPVVQQDTSVINLGKAIASVILSIIGFVFAYIGIILAALEPETGIAFMIIGLVPTIIGLAFGAGSIANFRQTSYIRSGKRIPVLILGIEGLATSVIALFLLFIVFITVVALLA